MATLCFARPRIEAIKNQQTIKHKFSALNSEPPLQYQFVSGGVPRVCKPRTGKLLKNEGESSIDDKINGRDKGRQEAFPDVTNEGHRA